MWSTAPVWVLGLHSKKQWKRDDYGLNTTELYLTEIQHQEH